MTNNTRMRLMVLDGAIETGSKVARILAENFDLRFVGENEITEESRQTGESLLLTDVAGLVPLERALSQSQTGVLLSALGEGVCLCEADARLIWANRRYEQYSPFVTRKVESICAEAAKAFLDLPRTSEETSRQYAFQTPNGQYFDVVAAPVWSPDPSATDGVKTLAIVWDVTKNKRLQQQLDAIDAAGSELVRLEADAVTSLNTAQRLTLLEDKIIKFTKDLMHFDHFNIYLLEKDSKHLIPVMMFGMPQSVAEYELMAETTGYGISGYVVATGRSYICSDVRKDARYLPGLEQAASSLSVPLRLHDRVVGVFNVESQSPNAFTEEDRQIAEIFGRYIALALNILDLLVVERVTTSGAVAVNVISEISQPLNDLVSEADVLRQHLVVDPEALKHIDRVIGLVDLVRRKVEEVAQGHRSILGIQEALEHSEIDPRLDGKHIILADDEPNIRDTIDTVLSRRGCVVTVCTNGQEAIDALTTADPGSISLVISDISMPDRNGYEVFAAARRLKSAIPVILMTGFGYDPHHSIVRASQEGLQCVLFKPFQIEQLLTEVLRAVRRQGN